MAQQSLIKSHKTLFQGVVTDGSSLVNKGDAAVEDALNFEFYPDKLVAAVRYGWDAENEDLGEYTVGSARSASSPLVAHHLEAIAGDKSRDFVFASAGHRIVGWEINEGDPEDISDNPPPSLQALLEISGLASVSGLDLSSSPAETALIQGENIWVAPRTVPCKYDFSSSPANPNMQPVVSASATLLVRDFAGVPDNMAVNYRPTCRLIEFSADGTSVDASAGRVMRIDIGGEIYWWTIVASLENPAGGDHEWWCWIDKADYDQISPLVTIPPDGVLPETGMLILDIRDPAVGGSGGNSTPPLDPADGASPAPITRHWGEGLTDAHRYNLYNQGWTLDKMRAFVASAPLVEANIINSIIRWPSNTDQWPLYLDTNGDIDVTVGLNYRRVANVWTVSERLGTGTSRAPRGRIIMDDLTGDRIVGITRSFEAAASFGTREGHMLASWQYSERTPSYRPGTITAFSERLAVSGAHNSWTHNKVYISPVLSAMTEPAAVTNQEFAERFRFYQINDPTSDIANELLADDGLTIVIEEARDIYKLKTLSNTLLVFAANGVWAITGIDPVSGFKTDDFSVYKVTDHALLTKAPYLSSKYTVVETNAGVFYWGQNGIGLLTLDEAGRVTYINYTEQHVESWYKTISHANKMGAVGFSDKYRNQVLWAYGENSSSPYDRKKYVKVDLATKAFSFHELAEGQEGTIVGFVQNNKLLNADGAPDVKMVFLVDGSFSYDYYILEQKENVFADFTYIAGEPCFYPGYLQTWPDTVEQAAMRKQAPMCHVFLNKTEEGWEDGETEGELVPVHPSSCLMTYQWDFHNSPDGNRWGTPREVYRHRRPYIPVDEEDDYDTGERVIHTRNKIYGRGNALALRFETTPGVDCQLLGYSIVYVGGDAR